MGVPAGAASPAPSLRGARSTPGQEHSSVQSSCVGGRSKNNVQRKNRVSHTTNEAARSAPCAQRNQAKQSAALRLRRVCGRVCSNWWLLESPWSVLAVSPGWPRCGLTISEVHLEALARLVMLISIARSAVRCILGFTGFATTRAAKRPSLCAGCWVLVQRAESGRTCGELEQGA